MQPQLPGEIRIPVIGEHYSVSKKIRTKDFVVEKRWVTKTVSVPVKVRYEELFVNGRRFGSGLDNVLASIRGSTADGNKARLKTGRPKSPADPNAKSKQVVPLFGEQVIVRKKMAKISEAIISKRKVTTRKKVQVNVKGERVVARHPDGTEEYIEEKPFTSQPHLASAAS